MRLKVWICPIIQSPLIHRLLQPKEPEQPLGRMAPFQSASHSRNATLIEWDEIELPERETILKHPTKGNLKPHPPHLLLNLGGDIALNRRE